MTAVLVIGAGIAGSAAAIALARGGVEVDIVESTSRDDHHGSGITLQGNALRVLRQLGLWAEVSASGYGFDTLGIRAPDPSGTLLVEMPDARTGGPDLPATLGMERPALATILHEAAERAGAKIRFDTRVTALTQDGSGVDATLSDGSTHRYDVVIGADGVRSWTRKEIGIEAHIRPTGMGIWRFVGPRPESVTRTDLVYGGVGYIAGYCPTGDDSLYAYIVEDAQDRTALTDSEKLSVLRDLSSHYHGPWDDIRKNLLDTVSVNYTWFESHVLEGNWHRGRVVLIGDAAHSCPPTLAQGAAQALEDAQVLTELLLSADTIDDSVFERFVARRSPRAREVVEASVQLGAWMLDGVRDADVPGLMGRIAHLVSVPA
ncbi:MAG: FAD-dependent monooxygenase [Rhodococcus sp. (in: high G+C Gram-positive bacteria)]